MDKVKFLVCTEDEDINIANSGENYYDTDSDF